MWYRHMILSKKSIDGSRRPASKIGIRTSSFPSGGQEIYAPFGDIALRAKEERKTWPTGTQTHLA